MHSGAENKGLDAQSPVGFAWYSMLGSYLRTRRLSSEVLLPADGYVFSCADVMRAGCPRNNMLQGAQVVAADGAGVGRDVPAPHGHRIPLLHVEHGLWLSLSTIISLYQYLSDLRYENIMPWARSTEVCLLCLGSLCSDAPVRRETSMTCARLAASCGEATRTTTCARAGGGVKC